jgi:hypothetical protein
MVHMVSFRSNEEFFLAVTDLVTRLEGKGHQGAAARLRDGYASLNGLTDGWALFLESIDGVLATASREFDHADRQALKVIRAAVHKAVYRR